VSIKYRVVGRALDMWSSKWECLICGKTIYGILSFKRHLKEEHDIDERRNGLMFSFSDATVAEG
jgi:hypothetical protein